VTLTKPVSQPGLPAYPAYFSKLFDISTVTIGLTWGELKTKLKHEFLR
jgi:hypothetical protein